MGRESSEKAFQMWMKIFDTFPEGIALIRNNNYIMYANRASQLILNDAGLMRYQGEEDRYDSMKFDLERTNIMQWVKNPAELKKLGQKAPK